MVKAKDKVYLFSIELDFLKDTVEQKTEEYEVIGVNNEYIAINDNRFTSIKIKGKEDIDGALKQVSIYQSEFKNYWDYIEGSLYTLNSSKKIAYKKIKKELEKYIQEKHGRYCNAITMLDKIEI